MMASQSARYGATCAKTIAPRQEPSRKIKKVTRGMPYVRPLNPGESPLAFFGAEIRRARERHSPTMPQSELASMIPCHPTVVSKVECAELDPPDGFPEGCDKAFPEMGGFFAQFRQHFPKWADSGIIPPWF